MEMVWVLMYTAVTWADEPGGLKRYKPMFQRMESEVVCMRAKVDLKQMETRSRLFQAIRCEELELPIQE